MVQRGSSLSWVLAGGMTVVTLGALFWPASATPVWTPVIWDKLPHVGLFFALTVAWRWTGLEARWVLVIVISLIAGSEIGQELLPIGRAGDVFDAMADAVGMSVAMLVPFSGPPKQPNLTSTTE